MFLRRSTRTAITSWRIPKHQTMTLMTVSNGGVKERSEGGSCWIIAVLSFQKNKFVVLDTSLILAREIYKMQMSNWKSVGFPDVKKKKKKKKKKNLQRRPWKTTFILSFWWKCSFVPVSLNKNRLSLITLETQCFTTGKKGQATSKLTWKSSI